MTTYNELVELITALALRRQTDADCGVLLLDGREEFAETHDSLDKYKYACITYLTAENIADIGAGISKNDFEKTVIDCIMLNRRIFVLKTQLNEIKAVCNPNFFNMLLSRLETLSSYGMEFLDTPETIPGGYPDSASYKAKRLVCEADILGLERDTTIKLANGAIVTPAAHDAAKLRGITIERHEE